MDNVKDNSYYLNKIISDLEFIIYHMESVDIEQLSKNDILLDSMLFRMIQISENAKNLTEDYKNSNPDSLERHIRFKEPNCSRLRQC